MLHVFQSLAQVKYSQLMEVYGGSLVEAARDTYPKLDANSALLQAEQDLYSYFRDVFFKLPGACLCLWEAEGRPVSALRLEPWQDGLLLTALETVPAFRRRGYAAALVRAVLEWAQLPVYSHVGKANIPSLRLHVACGFSVVVQDALFLDGSRRTDALTLRSKCKDGPIGA